MREHSVSSRHLFILLVAGRELVEIQKQIDHLPVKTDPQSVGQLLTLRRDVLFLEFDVAVRHSVRDTFLATGNVPAYKVPQSFSFDYFTGWQIND